MRAAAAVLVLLSHVRALTLSDAAQQGTLSIAGRALFAVTGLGHQAVIVFFVLSGFLVTRSMLRLEAEGRWSLARFGLERLVRLWLVLVPCLCLGGALDACGLAIAARTGAAAHYGDMAIGGSGAALDLGGTAFLGNLLFLQTIAVPVYGSNGPLWSLASEAWFYALAALAYAAWRQRGRFARAAGPIIGFAAVVAMLPWEVIALFPVWLCGAACAVACSADAAPPLVPWRSASLALAGVAGVLLLSRLHIGPGPLAADMLLGIATAWLVACAARRPDPRGWWRQPVQKLSDLSYSLYLAHVPLLAFCTSVAVGPQRLALGPASLALMLAEVGLALGCAAGLWWACERHTPAVRRWVLGRRPGWAFAGLVLSGRSTGP